VQIPNAVVYKSTIINYTSNPNRREDFTVNIGYDASIEKTQAVALGVLREHPAVLADPEPMVLAVALAPGSVTLRIFFWVNVHDHDRMKVKSAVIRLVKHRFEEECISVPDGTREMVFARDVQVRLLESHREKEHAHEPRKMAKKAPEHEQVATSSEGGLASEADSLKQQAERARQPEGEDLLKPPPAETPAS
jgi:small-conductance mechanosensitive channel